MSTDYRTLQTRLEYLKEKLLQAEQDLLKLKKEPYSHGLTVGDYVQTVDVARGEIRAIFRRKNDVEMAVIEDGGHLIILKLASLRKAIR